MVILYSQLNSERCCLISLQLEEQNSRGGIKIKTLEEIQHEKRQRLLADENSSLQKSESTELSQQKIEERKPTIAPRKIKIKPNKTTETLKSRPVKLKRTAPLSEAGKNLGLLNYIILPPKYSLIFIKSKFISGFFIVLLAF